MDVVLFTKLFRGCELEEIATAATDLGVDSIDLLIRPGFQVEPENVERDLPEAARQLAEWGVKIISVAGPTDEAMVAACAAVGVPLIRICVNIGRDEGYLDGEARLQREFDALVPLLERYGVTLGIQNHCSRSVANAMGLRSLIGQYDPRQIGAVWDAAHNALNGDEPELALDIIWSHLCLVNFKNAFWKRVKGPEAEDVEWRPYWTSGRHGLASWPRVAAELKRREYRGGICLTAEYSDEPSVERLIAEDIAYARALFADGGAA